jgi:hypothetical protein
MKQIGKKLIIIFFLVLWVFLISIPALSFFLAVNSQIKIGITESFQLRLFLLQEKNAEGLGLEIIQPFQSNHFCTQTTVRYWMWAGEPENVSFCQCQDQMSEYLLHDNSDICGPP